MYDPDKPLKQVAIDAVKLYFAPLRERKFIPAFVVILILSTVMAWIEVYKPFN